MSVQRPGALGVFQVGRDLLGAAMTEFLEPLYFRLLQDLDGRRRRRLRDHELEADALDVPPHLRQVLIPPIGIPFERLLDDADDARVEVGRVDRQGRQLAGQNRVHHREVAVP